MTHNAIKVSSKHEVEKASLLQALAAKEIEESHSLSQAKAKANQMVLDAEKEAQSCLDSLPKQLIEIENQILNRESELGSKEALKIRVQAEKQLADNIVVWQKRIDQAALNLVKRVLKVEV